MNRRCSAATVALDRRDRCSKRWCAKRYAAERRFRLFGLLAVGLSVAFLAFLLVTMAVQGLGRLHPDRSRADDRFPAIRPDARSRRACAAPTPRDGRRRRPRRRARQAAVAAYGEGAGDCSAAQRRARLASNRRRPDAARRQRRRCGCRLSSQGDRRRQGRRRSGRSRSWSPTPEAGRVAHRFNLGFLTASDATDPSVVGVWGALKGSFLTILVTIAARLPDRRARRALSRGIRAAQSLDRYHRGLDQQSRRGAVDHLRPARPRGVPQLHALAALGAAGRRADAGADDHAGDRHRRAQRDQVGAAVDPRCRARASARRRCRWCSTTSCRSRCPAS